MKHPEWVLKHKTKGTEIRKIGNNYYLYKISSKWNSKNKRTGKFPGSIYPGAGRLTTPCKVGLSPSYNIVIRALPKLLLHHKPCGSDPTTHAILEIRNTLYCPVIGGQPNPQEWKYLHQEAPDPCF